MTLWADAFTWLPSSLPSVNLNTGHQWSLCVTLSRAEQDRERDSALSNSTNSLSLKTLVQSSASVTVGSKKGQFSIPLVDDKKPLGFKKNSPLTVHYLGIHIYLFLFCRDKTFANFCFIYPYLKKVNCLLYIKWVIPFIHKYLLCVQSYTMYHSRNWSSTMNKGKIPCLLGLYILVRIRVQNNVLILISSKVKSKQIMHSFLKEDLLLRRGSKPCSFLRSHI